MLTLLLGALVLASGDGTGLPVKTPGAVGMSAERLATIDRVVRRGITAGGYPGASVVVGRNGAAVWQKGFGRLSWSTTSESVSPTESVYDLASLTKVVATTTAAMILFDEGRLSLTAPISAYLPAFSGGMKDSVTVEQLLTHRGGLPAGRDLWRIARTPEEARAAVLATSLEYRPGRGFIYSDLGAILLGMICETVAGVPLDEFLASRVFTPLGMTSTSFRVPDSVKAHTAPTEVTPPRGYPLRGEVHDENAYALGGVAGHAGLFSTAADLSIFAQMMLNRGEYEGVRIVSEETIDLFTRRTAGTRALGWDTADGDAGSGAYLSSRAYGHTGFTGTSIWIDPERQMFVILLTNRVHAARAQRPSKIISDVRSDLADAAALAVIDGEQGLLAMPSAFRADRAVGWTRPAPVARSRRAGARRSRSGRSTSASRSRTSRSRGSAARPRSASSSSRSRSATTSRPSTSRSRTTTSARRSTTARSTPAPARTQRAAASARPSSSRSRATAPRPATRSTTRRPRS